MLIAFCFGALLEGLAGFGTPVAITAVMLIALGFKPVKAAALALVADTVPVAFGAIAIPITTLGQTTGLPTDTLGAMVGRQTPFLALIVPFILVFMVDGRRGLRQAWPAALLAGVSFGVTQFATSNYMSIELADIIAALVSIARPGRADPRLAAGRAAARRGRRAARARPPSPVRRRATSSWRSGCASATAAGARPRCTRRSASAAAAATPPARSSSPSRPT